MRRPYDEASLVWPVENEVAIEVGGIFTGYTLCRTSSWFERAAYWLGIVLAIEARRDCKRNCTRDVIGRGGT